MNGLPFDNAVSALIPIMEGIDFVGIWVNGKMYREMQIVQVRDIGLKQIHTV